MMSGDERPPDQDLLAWARAVIAAAWQQGGQPGKPMGEAWEAPRGVFVTLKTRMGALRGCIGYPLPVLPLAEAMARAARAAAFDDPRFAPVRSDEWPEIRLEVSVLSVPTSWKPGIELVVGRDGLIVDHRGKRGLLLPQVAVEQGWDAPEFLDQVCLKAGLLRGDWRVAGARLSTFQAHVVSEDMP